MLYKIIISYNGYRRSFRRQLCYPNKSSYTITHAFTPINGTTIS